MDITKIFSTIILCGACLAPAVQANESDYKSYVEGALQVYKQFEEPSVNESKKFLTFVNQRWKSVNGTCVTTVCSVDGQTAALDYASVNKVKLDNEIQ